MYGIGMHRSLETTTKPELEIIRARSHIVTKSRSHLAYSNHSLSPLYQSLADDESNVPDCAIKIAVVGTAAIGKTSLLYRMFNNSTLYATYIPTTGIHTLYMYRGFCDFNVLPYSAVRPLQMQLSLWDYGFRDSSVDVMNSLINSSKYFEGVHAILLCYAIDDRESFFVLTEWIRKIYQATEGRRVAIILVGLRTDADRPYLTDAQKKMQRYQGWRVVSTMEAHQFSLFHRIPYLECTAAMGWFCDDVLATAVHHVLRLNCTIDNPLSLPRSFLPPEVVMLMPPEIVEDAQEETRNTSTNAIRKPAEAISSAEDQTFYSLGFL